LVNPEDGEKLTLAAAEGKLHLALRNTVDMTEVNPAPVYGATVFLGAAPVVAEARRVVVAKPAPPVAAPYTVQVIRGDKVETQSFPQ
jgi:Flp pilus assembly protein CpaB